MPCYSPPDMEFGKRLVNLAKVGVRIAPIAEKVVKNPGRVNEKKLKKLGRRAKKLTKSLNSLRKELSALFV